MSEQFGSLSKHVTVTISGEMGDGVWKSDAHWHNRHKA